MDLGQILFKQFRYVNSLPQHIIDSIVEYSKNGYISLNQRLRVNSTLTEAQKIMVDDIDEAFDSVPPIMSAITVYRGLKGNYIPELRSYLSTTYDIDIAKNFTGNMCCILYITIPSGSKILPIENISDSGHECEILLPRSGKYVITGTLGNIYHVTYIPEFTVEVIPEVSISQSSWTERILGLVDKEELEIFSPEEIVGSIISVTFKNENVPTQSIKDAILILQQYT